MKGFENVSDCDVVLKPTGFNGTLDRLKACSYLLRVHPSDFSEELAQLTNDGVSSALAQLKKSRHKRVCFQGTSPVAIRTIYII